MEDIWGECPYDKRGKQMKLRKKNTGEIYDSDQITFVIYGGEYGEVEENYLSLAELNQDWEEIKPKEPLIKDKKIRKAVRAWAEANDVIEVFIDRIGDGTYIELYDEDDGRRRISALRPAGLKTGEAYTIDELCGEEE